MPKKSPPRAKAKVTTKLAVAATDPVAPVTRVIAADQQHMLLLFIPLFNGKKPEALAAAAKAFGPSPIPPATKAASGQDPRTLTGVHFFMIHHMPAGSASLPMPIKGASVPTFQTAPDKDMLLVLSIYDADFSPYISAFFNIPPVVAGLNALMHVIDESGLVDPKDPSSAINLAKDGVVKRSGEFLKLLRRYNFADATIPAATQPPSDPKAKPKYFLGGTFPGLTIGKLLANYPDLGELYPVAGSTIKFDPATG